MPTAKPIPSVYQKLGVRPVIHGAGTTTRYGGSLMRPETITREGHGWTRRKTCFKIPIHHGPRRLCAPRRSACVVIVR
jgi:hypothetical protein